MFNDSPEFMKKDDLEEANPFMSMKIESLDKIMN